jgi:SAM-dependent methyltransferase
MRPMKVENFFYPGRELEIFRNAVIWKSYIGKKLKGYIGGDVLEVGAGLAETTKFLYNEKVRHWTCLEPDPDLESGIREKLNNGELPGNYTVIQSTIHEFTSRNQLFDTILYIDVLEHIPDDKGELIEAARLLKHDGRLIILVPAYQFLYSLFDRSLGHFRRYNRRSLMDIIPEGISNQKLYYLESAGIISSLANKYFLKQKSPTRSQVIFWDRVMVRSSMVIDRILGFSIGKSLIGVWKKD